MVPVPLLTLVGSKCSSLALLLSVRCPSVVSGATYMCGSLSDSFPYVVFGPQIGQPRLVRLHRSFHHDLSFGVRTSSVLRKVVGHLSNQTPPPRLSTACTQLLFTVPAAPPLPAKHRTYSLFNDNSCLTIPKASLLQRWICRLPYVRRPSRRIPPTLSFPAIPLLICTRNLFPAALLESFCG